MMLEPTRPNPERPNPERLSEALHFAAVALNFTAAKILAEELRWQEWAANKWKGRCDYRWPDDLGWDGIADCLEQLKLHITTIGRQEDNLERLEQDYWTLFQHVCKRLARAAGASGWRERLARAKT